MPWPGLGRAVVRALEVALELAGEPVGHGYGAAAVVLLRFERPAGEALGDAHAARRPVDVAPAQREQFALAQSRHGRGEVERTLERSEQCRRARRAARLRAPRAAGSGAGGAPRGALAAVRPERRDLSPTPAGSRRRRSGA